MAFLLAGGYDGLMQQKSSLLKRKQSQSKALDRKIPPRLRLTR
jgi:hypothetical protein